MNYLMYFWCDGSGDGGDGPGRRVTEPKIGACTILVTFYMFIRSEFIYLAIRIKLNLTYARYFLWFSRYALCINGECLCCFAILFVLCVALVALLV